MTDGEIVFDDLCWGLKYGRVRWTAGHSRGVWVYITGWVLRGRVQGRDCIS